MKGRCIGVSLFSCFYKYNNRKKIKESLPGAQIFWHCVQKRETPQCTCLLGSLTVEAAVIIPLFAAFFSFLLFYFQVMNVQLAVQGALEESARELAILSVKELEGPEEEIHYLPIANGLVAFKLSEKGVLHYVRGGIAGVSLFQSDFGQDEICLRADYVMCFPIKIFGNRDFLVSQSAYYRKWNGLSGRAVKSESDELVYMTEHGEVYHVKRSCPYLALSIRKILRGQLEKERNESGEKYEACEVCCKKDNFGSAVYVTDYGDRYHDTMTCSGLKRTIYQKRLSEVGGVPSCRKCAK